MGTKNGWVLCTEKMPSKYKNVLATMRLGDNDHIGCVVMAQRMSNGWDVSKTNYAYTVYDNDDDKKIVAWQAVPDAYKG